MDTWIENQLLTQDSTQHATNLWRTVGNTPLLPLPSLSAELPEQVELYAKAEWFNPGGSIKDRPALAILVDSLESGALEGGKTLLDSTSGNMGIAYATLAAGLNINLHLVIPANASQERLAILRAHGVELTLTDPLEGSDGARQVAAEMAANQPDRFYHADQYSHPANWMAHYQTTGPEIARQTEGRITHFIAGLGTTGTMTGVGRYLAQNWPMVERIAVQPDKPLHGLEGLKHLPSCVQPAIYTPDVIDQVREVSTEEAYAMAIRLARQDGLLVGISAAAAAVAALQLGKTLEQGHIVAVFPDSGLKYLGLPFWSES
ncbi:MAG: PLP-dependent cysteine synthase family protein [Anaerolineales bacterium]